MYDASRTKKTPHKRREWKLKRYPLKKSHLLTLSSLSSTNLRHLAATIMESATISSLAEDVSRHLQMIQNQDDGKKAARKHLDEEVKTAPLFSAPAQQVFEQQYQQENDTDNKPDDDGNTAKDTQPLTHRVYPQYGLLGLRMQSNQSQVDRDNLVYANISAPWSTFICGSQGSGKSHTLSCLLENALIASSPAGQLSSPLAGLVCHYDKFTAYGSTQLCEAAYLCSSGIPVRVLVSPTNYVAMKEAYENLPGLGDASKLLCVVPMYLSQRHLNINVIKTLMGIGSGPNQPLYVEVRLLMTLLDSERGLLAQFIMKILRNMARTNQGRASFDYNAFKQHIENEEFVKGQARPLQMRLDVLESFFEPGTVFTKGQKKPQRESGDIWQFSKGTLTIIDLSCPFVGPDDACALFNICISLFLKDRALAGRMIALDEAHKVCSSFPSVLAIFKLTDVVSDSRILGSRGTDRDAPFNHPSATPSRYPSGDSHPRANGFTSPPRPMQCNHRPSLHFPRLVQSYQGTHRRRLDGQH